MYFHFETNTVLVHAFIAPANSANYNLRLLLLKCEANVSLIRLLMPREEQNAEEYTFENE